MRGVRDPWRVDTQYEDGQQIEEMQNSITSKLSELQSVLHSAMAIDSTDAEARDCEYKRNERTE